ncbi:MAG: lipoyl(octanoyl) transferase [Deltaproteobacteria bacterium]|jgi:lipoate-protein ligase B|nr:lipoyl(octanoyl) transferase [Deltaproteobacteria bacterium]
MTLRTEWLGRVPYAAALDLQKLAVEDRLEGRMPDRLLLLEHTPVVTFGRGARAENLRVSESELQARGIDLHHVARGGDVTYHGPGQLVGYPIVDLAARDARDVVAWLCLLETSLIRALAGLGVAAAPAEGKTGVFVAGSRPLRKLASIGVGVKRWVTWHGFALNVSLDPRDFDVIVPCGLHDVEMSSVAQELGAAADPALFDEVREAVASAFERALP